MTKYLKDNENPNLRVVVTKFKIEGWEQNKIQNYFIRPLFETWINMRKEMNRLWIFGPSKRVMRDCGLINNRSLEGSVRRE